MWQIILGIGILFLLIEILAPSVFFLNFALAAFVCAFISCYVSNVIFLILLFCILSIVFIYTLRPIFVKKTQCTSCLTGMEEKYVGKVAKVIEDIDRNKGAITIYDERWQARIDEDGVISAGENIKIVGYESLIMKVEKLK